MFLAKRQELALLAINRARLAAPVQDDDIGDGRRFPHIYGPLNLDAVLEARPFAPAEDGTFAVPE